jgi:hypothetical protein
MRGGARFQRAACRILRQDLPLEKKLQIGERLPAANPYMADRI